MAARLWLFRLLKSEECVNIINDPRTIPQSDLPLLVLCNTTDDLVASAIDIRTKGTYDHAMVCINSGKFCTQGFTYSEVPMDGYMKEGVQLKFIKLVNANPSFNLLWRNAVLARLSLPWYKKMYDFLGIFGQAIGQPWIHTPGLDYCSVADIQELKVASVNLPNKDNAIIKSIPNESNPQNIDNIADANPDVMTTYGIYLSDEGVKV